MTEWPRNDTPLKKMHPFGRLGIQRLPAAGGLVHHIGLRQDLRLHAVHAAAAP
jgi:hypothetical protein